MRTKKVVINTCFGGFGLSDKAMDRCKDLSAKYGKECSFEREDPIMIQVIEELGEESFGYCSEQKIVEIPDDISYQIDDYDGKEHIAETHRTWY